MLLRSSSTPLLGSLLSSFTDSPNNNIHSETNHALKHFPPNSVHQHFNKLSFHQTGSFNLPSFSCGSSPISPSIGELERQNKGFRRVQSDGNLQDLAYSSCHNEDRMEFSDPPKRFSARNRYLVLETIPSFTVGKHSGLREEEEDEEMESESEDGEEKRGERLSVVNGVILREEVKEKDEGCKVSFGDQYEVDSGKEMHLAKGLGVEYCGDGIGGCIGGGGGGGGGSGDLNPLGSGGNDGDRRGVEEYYKKMVKENPGNPLFLRNYANFLYQCKQDREGAEEYYSRAILADPNDGEVLSQYGKLVWELYHDQERASSYFERAVQASPEDSHVHAAYASFLWDTEEEDKDGSNETQCLPPHSHQGAMATAGA